MWTLSRTFGLSHRPLMGTTLASDYGNVHVVMITYVGRVSRFYIAGFRSDMRQSAPKIANEVVI